MQKYYDGITFIINLKRRKDRFNLTIPRIFNIGYKNIYRFEAVDGQDEELIYNEWAILDNPQFNPKDINFINTRGAQGCILSHIKLWKYIIDNNIEFATVFEDDIIFHQHWNEIVNKYITETPNDYDIIYMGGQMEYVMGDPISSTMVWCTHAYIISLKGAKKILKAILNHPNGIYALDSMLINYMITYLFKQSVSEDRKDPPFIWYVWDGRYYKTDDIFHSQDRNNGLVFQDRTITSDINL